MIAEQLTRGRGRDGIRILLVEDNPGDVGLVEAALNEWGDIPMDLQVEQRLSPALRRLSHEDFAVVLLDLNLPDSTGFDTVTSVQKVVPRLPVVIMTGSPDESFARAAIMAGVQDYLIKDEVRPATLVRSILFAIDRKRIENELQALEKLATVASSSLDLNPLIEQVLETLMDVVGGQRAALVLELEGRKLKRVVGNGQGTDDPRYRETERALVSQVMSTGQTVLEPMFHPDGTVERTMLKVPLSLAGRTMGVIQVDWLSTHPRSQQEISLLRVAADKVAAGIANARAYEATRESERRAEEERLRLRTIIDTLPVGILITDANGKELESNALRERILGGRPRPSETIEDLAGIGARWADTGEPLREWPVVKALRSQQTTIGAVIDIDRLDGTRGTILNSAAPIVGKGGELIGAVALQQDITEQVRLERELAEAKERAEFYIDLLTHDIDNSLAAVSGYIQMIQSSGNLNGQASRWLAGADAALQASIDLIATVRKVQRSSKLDLEQSRIDLTALLEEVVVEARERGEGRADIHLNSIGEAWVVGTELLRDLFDNLIGNSLKHSPGKVWIGIKIRPETVKDRSCIRVEVADDGRGIPDDLKKKLFIKGVRGSKAPGQGLGLFLANSIVSGTGGRMWVEDRVPGDHTKGAKFVVLLPRAV